MTPLEYGAMLASYALASARLLGRVRPVADLFPTWAQFLIVALPILLTQFAGAVGAAHTGLDLGDAGLQLVIALGIAWRGQHPVLPAKSKPADEDITDAVNKDAQS